MDNQPSSRQIFSNDTVLVKVPNADGVLTKQRVGKLLLEISVRDLHQDLISEPPVGFPDAYCATTGKLLVSERHLRNVLPPQLRAISFAQKQICGCECCTITKMLHESLLKFRKKEINSNEVSTGVSTRRSRNDIYSFHTYKDQLKSNIEFLVSKPTTIVSKLSCPTDPNLNIPKLECVMGRCPACPDVPIPEFEIRDNNSLSPISYGIYMYHTKCKKHGLLKDKSSTCPECSKEL